MNALIAEGSMDKLEHTDHITEFYLSDIPLELIRLNKPCLISCTGKRGSVVMVTTHCSGNTSDVYLTINWEGVELRSYLRYDQSTKIKVDIAAYGHILRPCVTAHQEQLERTRQFLERVAVN